MSAESDARQARRLGLLWWWQAPVVCGGYLLARLIGLSWAEMLIDTYIAFASIAAMGVSYGAKAKAADAEKAGQDAS